MVEAVSRNGGSGGGGGGGGGGEGGRGGRGGGRGGRGGRGGEEAEGLGSPRRRRPWRMRWRSCSMRASTGSRPRCGSRGCRQRRGRPCSPPPPLPPAAAPQSPRRCPGRPSRAERVRCGRSQGSRSPAGDSERGWWWQGVPARVARGRGGVGVEWEAATRGRGGARWRRLSVGQASVGRLRWFGLAWLDVVSGANVGHVRHGARLRSAWGEQRAARVSGGGARWRLTKPPRHNCSVTPPSRWPLIPYPPRC